VKAVYRFYSKSCEVDIYARELAPKLLAAGSHPMSTLQMPKSNGSAKPPGNAAKCTDRRSEIPAAVSRPASNATARRCIDCRREIPVERLEAIPNTTRCLACQRVHEGMSPGSTNRRIDEGLAGTRGGHKRMRGQVWSAVRRRSRGED